MVVGSRRASTGSTRGGESGLRAGRVGCAELGVAAAAPTTAVATSASAVEAAAGIDGRAAIEGAMRAMVVRVTGVMPVMAMVPMACVPVVTRGMRMTAAHRARCHQIRDARVNARSAGVLVRRARVACSLADRERDDGKDHAHHDGRDEEFACAHDMLYHEAGIRLRLVARQAVPRPRSWRRPRPTIHAMASPRLAGSFVVAWTPRGFSAGLDDSRACLGGPVLSAEGFSHDDDDDGQERDRAEEDRDDGAEAVHARV